MNKFQRSDKIKQKARDMDWNVAVQNLNQVVSLYASRIASEGQYSPEAVERSMDIQASWQRIQKG